MKREKQDVVAMEMSSLLLEVTDHPNAGVPDYRPPAWVTDFVRNPREIHFRGRDGAVLLDEWRRRTESEVKRILDREEWGLLRVLGILRRLPIDRFFLGVRTDEGASRSFDPYLASVAEWTALKYAARDERGTRLEPWAKGPNGFYRDVPEVDRGSLQRITSLTWLTGPQYGQLDSVRKILARGGEATLRPDGNMDSRQSPELTRRFGLYDRRRRRLSYTGATAGTFLNSSTDDPLGYLSYMRMADWREDEGDQPWKYEHVGKWFPKREKRFLMHATPSGHSTSTCACSRT